MAAGGKNYFPELTGIRALMMYGIYNCHFNLIDPAVWGNTLYRLGQEMHLGVPIFYVLSGFLIYYLYGYKLKRLTLPWAFEYAKNRVARIYPIYFILLTFTYLWYGFPDSLRETIITYTVTQALFPDLVHAGIPQAWTLTIEETFYFSAPLIFLAALRWGLLVPCAAIFGLGIFLVSVDFPFNIYYQDTSHVFGRTLCGMIGCFAFGILLGKLVRKHGEDLPQRKKPVLTYGSLAGILAIMLVLTQLAEQAEALHPGGDLVRGSEHPLGYLLSYFVFPGVIVVLFWGMMTEASAVKRFLSIPLIVLLGRSSYCFYLLHYQAASEILEEFITHSRFGQILLLTLVSVVMLKLIEHPANQYIKFLGRPPKSTDDLFSGGLDRRSLGYAVLFAFLLMVQLTPLALITQHRADLAYALLAPGGWLQSLKVAFYVAAGVTFTSTYIRGFGDSSSTLASRGRKLVLALLTAATLLAAVLDIPWGRRFLEEGTLSSAGTVWFVLVVAFIGSGALVSGKLPALKQWALQAGIPLASPHLGVVFGASLVWFLGVDRNPETFSVVLAIVMFAFSIEVIWSCFSRRSARPLVETLVAATAIAVPLFIVSLTSSDPSDSPRVRAAQLTHQAEESSAQGDGVTSIKAAEEALVLWPEYVGAQLQLGLGYLQQGNLDAATMAFTRAIDLDPDNFVAHYNLGSIRLGQNRFEDAQVHLQKAVRLNDHSADAHNRLGELFEQAGALEFAIGEYEIAVRLVPTHATARGNLNRLKKQFESQH